MIIYLHNVPAKLKWLIVLVFLVVECLLRIVHAQSDTFTRIDSFTGMKYGMGYDYSRQGPTLTAKTCVDFNLDQTSEQSTVPDSRSKISITSTSQLVDKMGFSINAQLNAMNGVYKSDSNLDILSKTEIHRFSNTELYYNYKYGNEVTLDSNFISISPDYQVLLDNGVVGKDKFRAICGNGFVIGLQKGSFYYATY